MAATVGCALWAGLWASATHQQGSADRSQMRMLTYMTTKDLLRFHLLFKFEVQLIQFIFLGQLLVESRVAVGI